MKNIKIKAIGLTGQNGCFSKTGSYDISFDGSIKVLGKSDRVHFVVRDVDIEDKYDDQKGRALNAVVEAEYATSGLLDRRTISNIVILPSSLIPESYL